MAATSRGEVGLRPWRALPLALLPPLAPWRSPSRCLWAHALCRLHVHICLAPWLAQPHALLPSLHPLPCSKRKLLEKQKEGKKRMRRLGALQVPAEVFPELMRAI